MTDEEAQGFIEFERASVVRRAFIRYLLTNTKAYHHDLQEALTHIAEADAVVKLSYKFMKGWKKE